MQPQKNKKTQKLVSTPVKINKQKLNVLFFVKVWNAEKVEKTSWRQLRNVFSLDYLESLINQKGGSLIKNSYMIEKIRLKLGVIRTAHISRPVVPS